MIEIQNFKLIRKTKLTHDIFELEFEWEKELKFLYWQFITFLVPNIWWRAYSILAINWNKIILIIKKWELENWWRWGSKLICELNIWDKLKWVWPAWHFILKENSKNKLFLCTWTGFVPLYNQIIWAIKLNLWSKLILIFWLRTINDIFYIDQLEELKNKYNNFDYKIYLSKEKKTKYNEWYITNFLTKENINLFEEYYICWIPSMIQSTKIILENNWIIKKNILTEEY